MRIRKSIQKLEDDNTLVDLGVPAVSNNDLGENLQGVDSKVVQETNDMFSGIASLSIKFIELRTGVVFWIWLRKDIEEDWHDFLALSAWRDFNCLTQSEPKFLGSRADLDREPIPYSWTRRSLAAFGAPQ
ncbi:hypothetical protein TorRG33x02_236160 [Trema orientale]|uniref:Uncharacterized protein n=1 Tax=Trema orientale TaxID=63057 RepID=A0A2P5E1C5_TREOI|nr:hypothetical protein TorRG33x02_236160 [Trema orientale]